MEKTLDLSLQPTVGSTVQAKIDGQHVKRPSRSVEGAVAEEKSNDQRVGKLEQLQLAADEAFEKSDVRLSITYNEESGRFIYRGLDPKTGEVVREFPAEEVLERIARIRQMTGVALDRET